MLNLKTVRKTAASGIISEHYLRMLIAKGECPGIYSGNRFLVNVNALEEMLEAQSKQAVKNIDCE